MTGFAYLDKGNILHVVSSRETAEEYSKNGTIVETEIPFSGGYPEIGGEGIIVYSETEMTFGEENPDGTPKMINNPERKYPHLAALYAECKK